MINDLMTNRYGHDWSSFYSADDFSEYLYMDDDQYPLGSEYPSIISVWTIDYQ